jgi:hypothetical protein
MCSVEEVLKFHPITIIEDGIQTLFKIRNII